MIRLAAELFEAIGGNGLDWDVVGCCEMVELLLEVGGESFGGVEFADGPAAGGEGFEDGVSSPEPGALVAAGESARRSAATGAGGGGGKITQDGQFP
jgi:hypothetical protein